MNEQAANFEKDIGRLESQIQSESEVLAQLEALMVTSVTNGSYSANGTGKKKYEQRLTTEDKILIGKKILTNHFLHQILHVFKRYEAILSSVKHISEPPTALPTTKFRAKSNLRMTGGKFPTKMF